MNRWIDLERLIPTAALVLSTALLGAAAAAGQPPPSYFCSAIEPEVEVCVGEGENEVCAHRWRQCEFDFDGDEDFERIAYFFELRGSESDPPFIAPSTSTCAERSPAGLPTAWP